jgi:Golgi SNAP receptor complex protein 2
MSLLYNQTNKQIQQLHRDLNTLKSSVDNSVSDSNVNNISLSLIGAISTTITSINRLLGDFESYVSNQTDLEAQTKNKNRLNKLRSEYEELKSEFNELRKQREETIRANERIHKETERNNLFMQTNDEMGKASGISDNPYSIEFRSSRKHNINSEEATGMLMDQEMKLQKGNAKLDEILELGRHAFEDIVEQNETILKVREKMSEGLSTLGVSHGTVLKIEKVMWEDKIIFYIGASLTLFIMYIIWKYLG